MILHPVIPDILQRREQLADAISKGHLTPELSRYAQSGWAYILKKDGNPSLAYPSIGNFAGEDEETGAISYVVTTDEEDRDGDIVRPNGVHLKNYSLNPIVFFGHQEKPIPIGVCRSPDGRITVYPEENRMVDTIYFDLHDADAALIYDKCRRKILNATSIAFVPIEAWRRDDVRKARTHGDQSQSPPGWYFNQWDKTEVSIVGVPSNPKAVGLEKQLQEACRDVWDRERGEMSPNLQKAWQPYVAQAKGCWGGWCPLPGEERDIGGGVVLKAVEKSLHTKDAAAPCSCDDCSEGKVCPCAGKIVKTKEKQPMADSSEQSAEDVELKEQPSEDIDPEKACQALKAGTVYGEPLTDSQRKVLSAACAKAQKSHGGLRETCKALVKAATQADLDSPGVPGRNANPSGMAGQEKVEEETAMQEKKKPTRHKAALSQSDGRVGGYTVPPGGVQSDKKQEPLDDVQPPGWTACESCHGDGNCEACGGTGTFAGDDECPECDGSGECGACAGEGHVEKSTKRKQKQLDVPAEVPTTSQVLAALYSHAKAEAAYLDQLDDQYKDSLADYRRQQVEERMDMLKYQFSRAASDGEDIEKLCKDFEDEHDKGMTSTGPDQTVEPGEAGLVEQGQIPETEVEPAEKHHRKGRTMKQNTVPAEGAYAEDDPEAAAELDSGAAPFNKAAPDTDEWEEKGEKRTIRVRILPALASPGKWMVVSAQTGYPLQDLPKYFNSEEEARRAIESHPGGEFGYYELVKSSKATPGTEEWAEEEMQEPEHQKAAPGSLKVGDHAGPNQYNIGEVVRVNGSQITIKFDDGTEKTYPISDLPYTKSTDEEVVVDKEDDDAEEKAGNGICMCGMEVPDGAAECPGCGAPVNKAEPFTGEETPAEEMLENKQEGTGELSVETMAVDEEPVEVKDEDANAVTDPAAEEILERYRNPKSLKWSTRKHRVSKALLPFLKFRKAANGRKYLVRVKASSGNCPTCQGSGQMPASATNPRPVPCRTCGGLGDVPRKGVEPALDDSEVKSLTAKLAGAIDDLKAMYTAVPKHLKPGVKHVADQIWYVGKALTDKGKVQANGGGGSELTETGKVQANGGKGSELKDKGEQQGRSPTKAAKSNGQVVRQVSPAVQQKLEETMAKLRRFGILNGIH